MAQGFLTAGIGQQRAIFHHFFRRLPSGCLWAVAAGLRPFCEWLQSLRFGAAELGFLSGLRTHEGGALFQESFLKELESWNLQLDLFAVAEGSIVFPYQPLVRVEGPLWQAQMVETALLNLVNFSTLCTSLVIPIVEAAGDQPVWEFGARRAQGPNGALLAARSAWIAGCAGTSLCEAAHCFDIPPTGTMAHSWVMAFPTEQQAFDTYARCYPDQTILLIDTFDIEEGARAACQTDALLRSRGKKLCGVRLDSGDLLEESRRVRQLLDGQGRRDVPIILSGDLNADKIRTLKRLGAPVESWGVGTEIACAAADPHLTGVYKLSALQQPDGSWKPCAKSGVDAAKRSHPGRRTVVRCLSAEGIWCRDETVNLLQPQADPELVQIFPHPERGSSVYQQRVELLGQVMMQGALHGSLPGATEARHHCKQQIELWRQAQRQGQETGKQDLRD